MDLFSGLENVLVKICAEIGVDVTLASLTGQGAKGKNKHLESILTTYIITGFVLYKKKFTQKKG